MRRFTYYGGEKLVDGEGKIFEAKYETQSQSSLVSIRRYIGAFLIYLIYWLTIWGAFTRVIGMTLSSEQAKEQVETGVINSVWEYGWGNHYIWFLIVFCSVSYCSALLAGATAKRKGVIVASIANLPIVTTLSFLCVWLYMPQTEIEISRSWKIVLPVAVLGSVFFSVKGGSAGQQWQNNFFGNKSIFGIRPIHWLWLIFPLHFVIQVLVPKIVATIIFLFSSTLIKETKYSVMLFLMFVVFGTFIYFVLWGWFKTFRLLSLKHETNLGKCRIVLSVLFYLWGIPLLFNIFCILIYILFG